MARLQILELPEGSRDERSPFVLVVDQYEPRRYMLGLDQTEQPIDEFDGIAEKIGARGVLVFAETVEIPANDTTAYLTTSEERAEPARADERAIQAEEKLKAFMDRRHGVENERKTALLDALRMDRTRDWDDIRNAAAGLRKQRDAQAAELEQLRAGEESGWDHSIVPTPGQYIARWNQVTPEKRLSMAAEIIEGMKRSSECLMEDHAGRIAQLRAEAARSADA